jgi:SH3-like domain-containing protein
LALWCSRGAILLALISLPSHAQSPAHAQAPAHAEVPAHAKGNAASAKSADAKAGQATPADTKPEPPRADSAKASDAKPAPRFASLKRDKVYLRSGPSGDYPIQWVFVRKGLPVEILASFDVWRKIRDSEGTQGWVNQQMLSDRRSVIVMGAIRDVLRDPRPDGEVVAQVEPGVVAGLSKCDPVWCQVRAGGYQGWLRRDTVWGLQPDEIVQ